MGINTFANWMTGKNKTILEGDGKTVNDKIVRADNSSYPQMAHIIELLEGFSD